MKYNIEKVFENIGIEIANYSKIETHTNSVYRVESSNNIFFLKIYENEEERKIGLKLSKLYPLLQQFNVPVPEVIEFNDTLSVIIFPYLIISEVEGELLCEKIDSMNEKDKIALYYNFGQTLAKIHQITFKKFGDSLDWINVGSYIEANNKGPFNSWREMHKEIIEFRLSYFSDSNFEDLIEPIRKYFNNNSYLIDYEITPRLLHIDLNKKNIFVKDNKISGIIDFDGAFIGHNEEELMRVEGANFATNSQIKEAFFKGYEELINLDFDYEKRRTFYYLSRLLVHIDCIIKFGTNYVKDIEKEEITLRNEINNILTGNEINFDKNS